MIRTGADLKAARHALGWSVAEMARALRLSDPDGNGADRLRAMERGEKPLSGPLTVAAEALAAGFTPEP